MYEKITQYLSKKRTLALVGLVIVTGALLTVSLRANEASVPELAGRWKITEMRNINPAFRYYIWENLNFTIDSRGLIGNRDSPFTMVVMRGGCKPDCYYVDDFIVAKVIPGIMPLLRLVRDGPDKLFLYPTKDGDERMTFERLR
jgi:hypothetical protein